MEQSLEQNGFKLVESENDMNMELVKQNGDVSVRILFQSRSPSQFNENEQNGEENKDQNENEEQQQNEDYCDF